MQRQPCERQRCLQHRHDHRPLHDVTVSGMQNKVTLDSPTRSTRPASTTSSPTTPAHRTSITPDTTWSSRAERYVSDALGAFVGIGEREHGVLVGERCSRDEKHLPVSGPLLRRRSCRHRSVQTASSAEPLSPAPRPRPASAGPGPVARPTPGTCRITVGTHAPRI